MIGFCEGIVLQIENEIRRLAGVENVEPATELNELIITGIFGERAKLAVTEYTED
ncbi:MAG: hypothetical protein K2M95_01515 [Clostridiales bacterium]|nr:hypothetical protein [Clostridiales bacterium]